MKDVRFPVLAIAFAAALATLAACGGGGGGSVMPQPSPSPTIVAQGCIQTAAMQPAAIATVPLSGVAVRPPPHEPQSRDAFVPGVVAVRLAARDPRVLADAAQRVGGRAVENIDRDGNATIGLPVGADPRRAAQTLASMAGIVAAEPIPLRYPQAAQVVPDDKYFNTLPYTGVPNNPIQWDMYVTGMPSAWATATGFGASSVKVAVIDSGYDKNNPDLFPASRVAASVVFDLGTGTADTTASVQDGFFHGTDVSGIAAADTNNVTDVAGVAGNITLLEARVFPTPSPANTEPGASSRDVGAAITWAVANGAKVINLSLGSGSPDIMYEEPAVAYAIGHGVTVVAAAGNGNAQGIGQPVLDYPAADTGVIAVGASALCDGSAPRNYASSYEYVASYSNYMPNPSPSTYYVVAPGGDPSNAQILCSTNTCLDFLQWITNLSSTTAFSQPGQVTLVAGTSQATPHVAGLAALMLSKNAGLTPAQIGAIISTTAANIHDPRQGHGRIDAAAALSAVMP